MLYCIFKSYSLKIVFAEAYSIQFTSIQKIRDLLQHLPASDANLRIFYYSGYEYTCTFQLGGGNTFFKIGNYKQAECLDQCMARKKKDNAINGIGVYTDQTKGGCWCLKNMPNRNHYHMFKSCAIEESGKI